MCDFYVYDNFNVISRKVIIFQFQLDFQVIAAYKACFSTVFNGCFQFESYVYIFIYIYVYRLLQNNADDS